MQVTAPRSGTVIARDLRNLLGTFVEEGSQLLNVADDGSKEIIAMVGQREIDDVRALGRSEVKVCTAGWLTSSGFLERIEPQARDTLAWHALAATEGGPLTVREHHDNQDSRSLRLLEPLFQVRVRPTALSSSQLPAGIRVTASLGISHRNGFFPRRCAPHQLVAGRKCKGSDTVKNHVWMCHRIDPP